jgi:hypothetical protein
MLKKKPDTISIAKISDVLAAAEDALFAINIVAYVKTKSSIMIKYIRREDSTSIDR